MESETEKLKNDIKSDLIKSLEKWDKDIREIFTYEINSMVVTVEIKKAESKD